ncbi:acyl-CoA carboxylase epsilon subunit [Nocardioides donggukensis]|uniref:acyl-CoA carboxylase epsilon subunit n=1 Tax=Nocardioides donggukensis TaxID=2774019 RepID=UPI00191F12F3|nr:acyl-CoA carboxylase epsilon subunit [Nocardioides donggukensis]
MSTTGETDPQGSQKAGEDEPVLRIITEHTTPEEVAALVAVLAAMGGPEQAAPPRRTPEWQAPHRAVRRALPQGPGGWRSSGLPR